MVDRTVGNQPRPGDRHGVTPAGHAHLLDIEVVCSRGTYIRVLASDIGKYLGCGAHLTELRRLASGRFSVQDSLPGDVLKDDDGLQKLMAGMLTVDEALEMLEEVDEDARRDVG